MATATYRITEKKCATCRWWGGRRICFGISQERYMALWKFHLELVNQ